MKSLFDAALITNLKQRIESLQADSQRQWGKMSVDQMIAHCAVGLEMALGVCVR